MQSNSGMMFARLSKTAGDRAAAENHDGVATARVRA
jgi:hypothetical protein